MLERQQPVFPIIPAGERVTEPEILEAVIGFLETRGYKEARFKEIWTYLPGTWFKPTEADRFLSKRSEQHWHTQVRNIWAHLKEHPDTYDSRIRRRTDNKDGFQLTSYVKKRVAFTSR
jgi:hypothetical protein